MTEKEGLTTLDQVDTRTLEAINAIRARYRLTIEDIAKATNLSTPGLWRILKGNGGPALPVTMAALTRWLEDNRSKYPLEPEAAE